MITCRDLIMGASRHTKSIKCTELKFRQHEGDALLLMANTDSMEIRMKEKSR